MYTLLLLLPALASNISSWTPRDSPFEPNFGATRRAAAKQASANTVYTSMNIYIYMYIIYMYMIFFHVRLHGLRSFEG